jgi:hypothetical protein
MGQVDGDLLNRPGILIILIIRSSDCVSFL